MKDEHTPDRFIHLSFSLFGVLSACTQTRSATNMFGRFGTPWFTFPYSTRAESEEGSIKHSMAYWSAHGTLSARP